MANFGYYEIIYREDWVVYMSISDKMVDDAVNEHEKFAKDYVIGMFCMYVEIQQDVILDSESIELHDLSFKRMRSANYGDHCHPGRAHQLVVRG